MTKGEKKKKLCRKKPFFLLVAVDAPISTRFARAVSRGYTQVLEVFVRQDDLSMYKLEVTDESEVAASALLEHRPQIRQCMNVADVLLLNDGRLEALKADIDHADLTSHERLRPSWDTYFMTMADLAARRSNCMKRRVGCVLVQENRVIATGYNGTAKNTRNCNEGGCKRCNSNASRGQGSLSLVSFLLSPSNSLLSLHWCGGNRYEWACVDGCSFGLLPLLTR